MSAMKVVRIIGENVRSIKVIDIRPNEHLTQISGANGAGKTTVLDLILYGLAPRKTLPTKLLRKGTTRGKLRIDLKDDLEGYTVLRDLDENGGNLSIEPTNTKHMIKDPVEWLEKITGKLGFDPLEFMRFKPEEQFAVLRGIVELKEDVDDLEARNEQDEETKNSIRATRRNLKRQVAEIQVVENLPATTYDIPALMEEQREADRHNRTIEDERRRRQTVESDILAQDGIAKNLAAQLAELELKIESNRKLIATLQQEKKAWKPLDKLKDRSAIDERIREASASNAAISANAERRIQRDRMNKDISDIDKQEETLEENIRARKLTIGKTMAEAKFPIEGLSFETEAQGSGGRERKNPKKIVTYHGIPLSDASTAEQIRVSVSIGMATNPEVKTLLIREGSLIDDKGMELLKELAREHDFQYLMEIVDTSGKVGIYLEDGAVKAVNSEPAEEPVSAAATRKKKGAK